MSNETNYKIIDDSTGEIIADNISSWKTPVQEKIIKDYYKKKDNYYRRKRDENPFVMCFIKPIQSIIQQLTLVECGIIIVLLPFIALNKGGLLMKSKKEYLELSDIIEILGLSRRQTIRILSKLESMDILTVHKFGKKMRMPLMNVFTNGGAKTIKISLRF